MEKISLSKILKDNIFSLVCLVATLVFFVISLVLPHYSYTYMFKSDAYTLFGLIEANPVMIAYFVPAVLALCLLVANVVLTAIPTDPNKQSALRTTAFVLSIIAAFVGYIAGIMIILKQNMIPFAFGSPMNVQNMEFGHYALALSCIVVGFTSCYTAARNSD